jgi:hypothetical protein
VPGKDDKPFAFNRPFDAVNGSKTWGLNYIRRSIEIVFSDSVPNLVRQVCNGSVCRDWTTADGDANVIQGVAGPSCTAQVLSFRLFDKNNNPLPYNTAVTGADATKVSLSAVLPDKVASTNAWGGTIHHVTVKPDSACAPGAFMLRGETGKGNASGFNFRSNAVN